MYNCKSREDIFDWERQCGLQAFLFSMTSHDIVETDRHSTLCSVPTLKLHPVLPVVRARFWLLPCRPCSTPGSRRRSTLTTSFLRLLTARLKRAAGSLTSHGCNLLLQSPRIIMHYFWCMCTSGAGLTCLSGSMLANPPLWLACPPLEAISETSSLGRLAKLPGSCGARQVSVCISIPR